MLVNELFSSVHFFWIQRICFGYLRIKGVLEVNSMAKGLLRREFPCLGFVKHPCILRVLRREFVFNLFCSMAEVLLLAGF